MSEIKNIVAAVKIGVISDSHDNMENINKAVKIFKDRKVDLVFHLGDYVSRASVDLFQGLKFKGVFGNNDGDKLKIIKSFNEIKGELFGNFGEIECGGLKCALCHGAEEEIKDALVKCGKYDVVFSGHTHIIENKKFGKTISINPGTAHGFGKRATVAIFDTSTFRLEIIDL